MACLVPYQSVQSHAHDFLSFASPFGARPFGYRESDAAVWPLP